MRRLTLLLFLFLIVLVVWFGRSTPVLVADGYDRKDGLATVPDAAGFGLTIDERAFTNQATIRFDVR